MLSVVPGYFDFVKPLSYVSSFTRRTTVKKQYLSVDAVPMICTSPGTADACCSSRLLHRVCAMLVDNLACLII